MDFLSRSPFAVASILWQPRADRWMFTVVCKATFVLRPDLCPLAPQQDPPHPADVYRGNDERCSLLSAGELVPFKRTPEVLLVGSAFAPRGAPVPSLCVRLVVGGVQKSIEVMGDRFITPAGELTAPTPFARMPLVWERAAGGPGTANPAGIGMGSAAVPDAWGRVAIPNLQPPASTLLSWRDVLQPAGFGPIAPHWPSRAGRLRAVAQGWDFRRWSAQPLPAGFDPWFFNTAPDDQQLPELRGEEQIVLENLHPDSPRIETRLECAAPRALVDWPGGTTAPVDLRCDTLIIDTDRGSVALIWRGHVPLDHPQRAGQVIITQEQPEPLLVTQAWLPDSTEHTVDLGTLMEQAGGRNPLPFVDAPSSIAEAAFSPSADEPDSSPGHGGETIDLDGFQAQDPLPFGSDLPAAEPLPPPIMGPAISQAAERESAVEPPPMIGPIGLPVAAQESTTEASSRPEVVDIPLERCAAIAASIDRRGGEKEEILKQNELSAEAWTSVEQRWDEAIDEAIARGKMELLQRFDAAYVAQLEKERGPIQVEEYARLGVAAERDTTEKVLAELSIPEEGMMRVERVWLQKIIMDKALGKRVRQAREQARAEA